MTEATEKLASAINDLFDVGDGPVVAVSGVTEDGEPFEQLELQISARIEQPHAELHTDDHSAKLAPTLLQGLLRKVARRFDAYRHAAGVDALYPGKILTMLDVLGDYPEAERAVLDALEETHHDPG